MENKNSIVKFEDTELQINVNKNCELEMDMEELSKAIGVESKKGIEKIIENHSELKEREFSYLKKVLNNEGGVLKKREKRIFTQDGIYEVALLANTERAKKFRKFARDLITRFRKNEITINAGITGIVNDKLDKMVNLVQDRNDEIDEILEYLNSAKDKFEKIDEIEKDVKDIKSKIDELIDFVNDLSDEVYGGADEKEESNGDE